jgi:hypothetical protein
MVSLTKDGKILYRAAHPNCLPFPLSGDTTLMAGIPRNFKAVHSTNATATSQSSLFVKNGF